MALFSPLVGLLGFPLLPHWILESQLIIIASIMGISHDTLLHLLLYLWPSACTLLCAVALIRVLVSRGGLRGRWIAIAGLVIEGVWLLVTLILIRLFTFR